MHVASFLCHFCVIFAVIYIPHALSGIIYVGNGDSDISPAKYAHHIFDRGELLTYCRENNLKCESFDDLTDVVRELELL